ncbi:MAG: hypothetical protein ACOX3U_05665 [Christensenellales bacterium]|jgi:ubiquinone biosynthesis protein UbiJ
MASKSLKPRAKRLKRLICSTMFALLSRAIKACYRLDDRVKGEFDEMPQGTVLKLSVLPSGPALIIKKEQDEIITLKEISVKPSIEIAFKNIESALLALSAEKSVSRCFAEQRFIIYGDLSLGAAFVRIINIVEAYLFPRIWASYLMNGYAPSRKRSVIRIYLATIFGI